MQEEKNTKDVISPAIMSDDNACNIDEVIHFHHKANAPPLSYEMQFLFKLVHVKRKKQLK